MPTELPPHRGLKGRVLIGHPSPFSVLRTVIAAPTCLTDRPEQVASTGCILLPTAAT